MASGVDDSSLTTALKVATGGSQSPRLLGIFSHGDPTQASVDKRAAWILLVLFTVVAGVLKLPFLSHESLWLDEVFTREIVAESTISGVWQHIRLTESTPPLYYIIGWLGGARSAVAIRVIPALALTAASPTSYFAFRRLIGQAAALVVAAMVAVNPMLAWYGTDGRSYGLFVLVGLLSIWAFTAVLEHPSRLRYATWALTCITCGWTHYFGGFLVVGEIGVLLWLHREKRLTTLLWTFVIVLCVSPLIPLVLHQGASERTAFIESEPLTTRLVTTVRQFAMGPNVPRPWLEGAGVVLWCIGTGFGAVLAIRGSRRGLIVIALAAISIGLPLLMSALGIVDRFYARNVLMTLPIVLALAAPAMLRMRAVLLVGYLVLAIVTSVWVASDWRYEQADWRDALARVETIDASAPVIAVTRLNEPVVRTYLKRNASPPGGIMATQAWLVVEPIRGPHDRALAPAQVPTVPGFIPVRSLTAHAFRLVFLEASQPTRLTSGVLTDATVFPGKSH